MKTFEKYIQKYLNKLGYQQTTKCKTDLVNTLRVYKCLAPSAETYVFETGEVQQLLNLGGTIPIKYKEENYNIPVKIWVLRDYPDTPPFCYVIPTKDMELSVSPYLDHSGLVELPCLTEWNHSATDLNTFLQIARITFSETPPVFSKPKVSGRRKVSKDEFESVWEEHFPDEDEKLLKTFFLKSASETCRSKLGEEYSKTKAEVDSLHSVNKDLIDKQEEIQNILENMKAKEIETNETVEVVGKTLETFKSVLIERSKEVKGDDIEELIKVPNAAHAQLLEALANDEAINDCIYALGQGLENEKITLEVYLRKVRELSRKQFTCRILVNSLQQLKLK
jgi:ESCRT-I complex subunit TSG101